LMKVLGKEFFEFSMKQAIQWKSQSIFSFSEKLDWHLGEQWAPFYYIECHY